MINNILWTIGSTSVAILVCLLLRSMLKKVVYHGYLSLLWIPIIIQLCLPFSFASKLSAYQYMAPMNQTNLFLTEMDGDEKQNTIEPDESHLLLHAVEDLKIPEKTSTSFVSQPMGLILLGVWFIGVAIHLLGMYKKKIVIDRLLQVQGTTTLRLNKIVADTIIRHHAQNLEVLFLDGIQTSALYGFVHPKLLVSNQLDRLSEPEITLIMTHELIHYRKQHHIIHGLLFLLRTIYWFHPLVVVMVEKIKLDLEYHVDALVIKQTNCASKDYGHLLLSVIEEQNHLMLKTFKNSKGKKHMKERIDNLMHKKQIKGMFGFLVAIAIVFGLVFLTRPEATEIAERVIKVPIVIENIHRTLTFESEIVDSNDVSVDVTVQGEKKLIDSLSAADLWASVDGSKLGLDDTVVYVDIEVIQREPNPNYKLVFDATMKLANTTERVVIEATKEDIVQELAIKSQSVNKYIMPIDSAHVTCDYECYSGHKAIDMENTVDSYGLIYAIADGVVVTNDYEPISGYFIFSNHGNGVVSGY